MVIEEVLEIKCLVDIEDIDTGVVFRLYQRWAMILVP